MPRLHPDHSRLNGAECDEFMKLLVDIFDVDALDRMLATKLDKNRQRLTLARSLDSMVFDIIEDAEMKSWSAELLLGARAARPTDVGLFRFAQTYGLEPQTPSTVEMERIIDPALGPFDPMPWLTELTALLGRICRVEIKGTPIRGTGFLVGPDLVLTNYHVVAQVINWQRAQKGIEVQGPTLPARLLKCRFDHKVLGDDMPLSPGEVVDVHVARWLVDYSPAGNAPYEATSVDELDYALLRLSRAVGEKTVDESSGATRGWIDLPLLDPDLAPGTPLFILGHPLGDSLKLSLNTNAVIGLNGSQSRLRYRTNTQAGSSGSPCFTREWTLAALHHAGAPGDDPAFNEGIPIAAIRALWLDRITADALQPWQLELLESVLPG